MASRAKRAAILEEAKKTDEEKKKVPSRSPNRTYGPGGVRGFTDGEQAFDPAPKSPPGFRG